MATLREKQLADAANFVMPKAEVGDIVIYRYGHSDAAFQPAIVLEAGEKSLCLGVFHSASLTMDVRSGVKHVGDPTMRDMDDNGIWEHSPRSKAIEALGAKLNQLISEIGGIKSR